jgi:hypothetical protein
MPANVYQSREELTGIPDANIRPQAIPQIQPVVGAAIAAGGSAVADFASTLMNAQAATRKARATSA